VKHLTVVTAALLAIAVPLYSQTAKGTLVAGTDHTCSAQLPNGTSYEVHYRTLKARWKGRDVYAMVKAYYKPGSGEFLYYSSIWSKEAYPRDSKEQAAWTCEPKERHVVLLENAEWADCWVLTTSPRIEVYHSTLRFSSIGEAWQYVSTRLDECQVSPGRAKCYSEIPLYKSFDFDFFRPESLRFDARPYSYDPLVSVKKAGSTWEVLRKGADEPNRALVILDENFKLVKTTTFAASK
jgi:hypothetical protein